MSARLQSGMGILKRTSLKKISSFTKGLCNPASGLT